jgi:uncharacterized protein
MDVIKRIAGQMHLPETNVSETVRLMDDGNTLPFIARYRKEVTGGMTDEQIEQMAELASRFRALEDRRGAILKSLGEQGVSDARVLAEFEKVDTLTGLEDLYAPYRPKRKTRASIAKARGLDGLAQLLINQPAQKAEDAARPFVQGEVASLEEALAGAKDIVAEVISDTPRVRSQTRELLAKRSLVRATQIKGAEDARGTYLDYYDFSQAVDKVRPHQLLAIRRAVDDKVVRFKLELDPEEWKRAMLLAFRPDPKSGLYLELLEAIEDAGARLLIPSLEREVKSTLLEQADEHAIAVFSKNLRNLLLQPPLKDRVVMGIDPGYRTGCKVAVVDPTGKVLATGTIYPHEPQKEMAQAFEALSRLIDQFQVTLVSIGNGTASRESEQLAAEVIKKHLQVRYIITSEAGASVYSASPLARKELPALDVSLRGAVSIARRVQDPLAELVKIDPKSIGVGMYQHDVDQKKLAEALSKIVSAVVNEVGVDANTASPALLAYVAGIGPKLAEAVVAYRETNGAFKNRREVKKVAGMGERAFEQSAGFLRVYGGNEPLDATSIHPESYPAAREFLKLAKLRLTDPAAEKEAGVERLKKELGIQGLAELLGIGTPTLNQILSQIIQPDDDPRRHSPRPVLRANVLTLEALKPQMALTGTVRNVTDFGAFVDIGLKSDALLHRSKWARGVELKVGDVIQVVVETVDPQRQRVGLALQAG